jgi:hypothetical protein
MSYKKSVFRRFAKLRHISGVTYEVRTYLHKNFHSAMLIFDTFVLFWPNFNLLRKSSYLDLDQE